MKNLNNKHFTIKKMIEQLKKEISLERKMAVWCIVYTCILVCPKVTRQHDVHNLTLLLRIRGCFEREGGGVARKSGS